MVMVIDRLAAAPRHRAVAERGVAFCVLSGVVPVTHDFPLNTPGMARAAMTRREELRS
ncbi:MAG TPA: hypothetical protein VGF36_05095 [Rhodopila sp.]|jgi:hypothetical protein